MARVLIVDDDPDIRTTLRLLLEDEGYVVEERGDGLARLGVLRASPNPLVVLLDYRMPHLNGDEVLRAVAAEGDLTARHAFVLLTASPREVEPNTGRLPETLAVRVVSKPFELGTLLDVVAEAACRLDVDEEATG